WMMRCSMARDEVEQAAARWFTRLQSTALSTQEILEWQRWMALDAEHAQAFGRLEEVWHAFDALARPAPLPRALVAADPYDGSVSVRHWNAQAWNRARQHRAAWWAIAAALLVVFTGAILVWSQHPSASQMLKTQVGENRIERLADGSRV